MNFWQDHLHAHGEFNTAGRALRLLWQVWCAWLLEFSGKNGVSGKEETNRVSECDCGRGDCLPHSVSSISGDSAFLAIKIAAAGEI